MLCQNVCLFSGRVGGVPEPQEVGNSTVYKFGVACDDPYKDNDGEWHNGTSWVNVEHWVGEGNRNTAMTNRVLDLRAGDVVIIQTQYKAITKEGDNGKRTFHSFKLRNLIPATSAQKPKDSIAEDDIPFEQDKPRRASLS